MDVIVDPVKGHAMNLDTWEFLVPIHPHEARDLHSSRDHHVNLGRVRADIMTKCLNEEGEVCPPLGLRVIRDLDHLWGFNSVRLKELLQLYTGNSGNYLLSFALVATLEIILINGFAILEHPAEPEHLPTAASIWRLPVVRTLLALPNVQRIRLAQGLMGSATPKPTHLLRLSIYPDLMIDLHAV